MKSKGKNDISEEQEKKKRKNLIYSIVAYSTATLGVVLLIISQATATDILFFISLGVLGLGIMLIVQRSVYTQTKYSSDEVEEKRDKERLELRKRQ
ncbi:MAG: hypothetical protein K9W45_10830 [Candidatus Heimdallarchaeum aukensis]|uniref:Uncharacterized protein n=1 Tax=Candidatus Heimdallarchaeum aukensis TaxID=2876573 RepID=A0A9Y1BK98_9ARCH|nr:MAG: hypothetical protein K9W45_10830 [Candidatus Heimdallarchaeum aukensis]